MSGSLVLPNSTTADADPDAEYHSHTGTVGSIGDIPLIFGIAPGTSHNVSLFFLETTMDYITQVASGYWSGHVLRQLSFMEPRVIAHEIGHQFGLPDVLAPANTLMSPWNGRERDFDGLELSFIRSSTDMASH